MHPSRKGSNTLITSKITTTLHARNHSNSCLCCAVPHCSKMAGVVTDSRIGQARMSACSITDLLPDRDTRHIRDEFNFLRLCSRELREFAVVRNAFVALVPVHHASHTMPRHTMPRRLAPRKASHQERIARMSIRCCAASFPSVRWTESARACGAHTSVGRLNRHERVIRYVHSSSSPRHGTRCHALCVFHTCLCG